MPSGRATPSGTTGRIDCSPTATHTVMRAILGLIIPTIMFVVAVLGEVFAERILEAILP